MNTQNNVLKFVENWFRTASEQEASRGIDAKCVAEQMGIWQNDAAAALNGLCGTGVLVRKGARPVRYFLPEPEPAPQAPAAPVSEASGPELPAFQRIIGHNGSLSLQTQLAKAGASYPPYGMHMLIIGESGVGKTLMAEEIWRYMNQNRPDGSPKKPFVVFNCAEYAENPQFLLSQLFGYEKGAFTGADATHRGLVEEANGGVLFLDEIHRLPATGQEMLFTLLDRGQFRRMGSSRDMTAHLMVIGATTEDPDASFLNTFRRRIPMVIEIPNLAERPVKERIALIFHFLTEESTRLSLPIRISPHALKLLVSHHSDTNIGDLKNEIQLCCARGYLIYRNEQQRGHSTPPYIDFTSGNLSRHLQGTVIPEDVERYISTWVERHSLIVAQEEQAAPADSDRPGTEDLYRFIENRLDVYRQENLDPQAIGQLVSLDIQSHFTELAYANTAQSDSGTLNIYDCVTPNVMAAASELVRHASNKFNYIYPDIICNTLALYLQQIKFQAKVNQAYSIPNIQLLVEAYQGKKRFVTSMIPMLNKALDISLTDDEATIIALLLDTHDQTSKKRIGLIVMGHGKSTASSIADFTNQVLMTKIVRSVDVPISLAPEQALEQLCRLTEQIDEGKGVIILTDTDNFEYYENQLRDRTGILCKVVPGMSTAMALELCKSILTTDDDIRTITYSCIENYRQYVFSAFQRAGLPSVPKLPEEPGRNVILVCCITGTGSARRMREWLLQFPAIYMHTEIMPIGLRENIYELAQRLGKRLKIIIGFTDPRINGVPFISMENVTSQEGINRITMILKGWSSTELDAHWSHDDLPLHIRFEQIAQRINYFAPSIDPEQAARQADYIVHSICHLCPKELPSDLQVRMYIHVLTMFERLKTQEPMPMPEDEEGLISQNPAFFRQLTEILETACARLGLELQPSEAYCFLLTLPMDEIT